MKGQRTHPARELLADVLDNLPGLVFRTINDGHWTFEYASQGAMAMLGFAPDELVNVKTLRNMIPKADQTKNRKILSKITQKNPHYQAVYRIKTASGQTKWVKEEGTGVFSAQGRLLALDAFLVDITEQKVTEERLRQENTRLRSEIKGRHRLDDLIGRSVAMGELYDQMLKAAKTHATVVITGESGTGKELAARAIRNLGDRSERPFIVVNCGAIAPNLYESEFFGYRKGAFSGALTDREGLLDAARGGTLFLDEVGELPLNLQVKLLRALDGGGYTRVGDSAERHSDFRLIAATHRNLEDLVRTGTMREDFYYRINAIRLRMPPLRERKDDILTLADYFLDKYADTENRPRFSVQEKRVLRNYGWPGNVRELQNVVQRYLTFGALEFSGEIHQINGELTPKISKGGYAKANLSADMAQIEKKMIQDTLRRCNWHIGKSAAELGFSRRTMQRRMNKYSLRR